MTFGERLQELRKQAGLTQGELAAKIGVPIHTVRNHEQDLREPVASTIYGGYCKALGVDCRSFSDVEFVNKPQQPPRPTRRKKG